MRLSFLIRITLVALLGVFAFPVVARHGPALAIYLAEARASTDQPARFESRALVYRLEGDWSTTFAFSQPAEQLKIIVQPSIRPELRDLPHGFVYGLRIRLTDASGAQIEQRDIHFHAAAPDTVYRSGEKWRFFRNRPEMVAGQDEIVIEAASPAARVEVSLVDPDPGIVGADVRIYEQHNYLGDNAITAFRRRSDAEQRRLAEANAFPPRMLTDAEMNFLALNQWRPVGPIGIDGRDYEAIVLYEASIAPDAQEAF